MIIGTGYIRENACIFQDHHFIQWPCCLPPQIEYDKEEYQYLAKNPNMIFNVYWNGQYWDCKAYGYGIHDVKDNNSYGNGSIFVRKFDDIEIISIHTQTLDVLT